jgi:hypothetical protein
VVDAEVDEVRLPGALGELGVLPGHNGLLTSLATGERYYRSAGEGKYLAVSRRGDDGCWRLYWVLWNGDVPPTG